MQHVALIAPMFAQGTVHGARNIGGLDPCMRNFIVALTKGGILAHHLRAERLLLKGERIEAVIDRWRDCYAPEVIASGPTVPDPTTCADALAILKRYAIELPAAARDAAFAGAVADDFGLGIEPGFQFEQGIATPGFIDGIGTDHLVSA